MEKIIKVNIFEVLGMSYTLKQKYKYLTVYIVYNNI